MYIFALYTDNNFASLKNEHGRPIMDLKIWNFITTISDVILILNVSSLICIYVANIKTYSILNISDYDK